MRINTALTKVLGPVVLALAFAAGLGYGNGEVKCACARKVWTCIAAYAADFVTPHASNRMKRRFGFDEFG